MEQFAKETVPVSLEAEMRHSYLDYAMSVIVGRALPDVRDGLKPVHRRVLFAMQEANIVWNRPYVKCARVVGDVMGKYHPHGDLAIYDTLVRMAQEFSLRYPLVDGQGNFGSIDGDNAAAMRYTECRLQKITAEMLADLDRDTVDFAPNYDGKEQEPTVLPSRLPNLLINGSSGIAVGMATNIPPHNLTETIGGCLAVLDNPEITVDELMELIPAPDFPTAGIIYGLEGVREGYRTGRGRVVIRARTHIEDLDRGNRQAIIVDEIPYQVNKANLLSRIGELVRDKKIEGISDLRDESDRTGMRVVIELKRGEVAEIVQNNLFKLTQLQDSFGMNMVALVDGQPRLLNLKQFLEFFLSHRREVVTRRTVFDLRRARERGHVLEGLAVALSNVDEIIALIKASPTPAEAKTALMGKIWRSPVVEEMLRRAAAEAARPDGLPLEYGWQAALAGYRLSDVQAQAILELRLQRLTGLEQDKITAEYRDVMEQIVDLLDILANPSRVTAIVRDELKGIRDQFGDARRSEIVVQGVDLSIEDLIAPMEMVVTLSHGGYMKAQPVDEYRAQKRGGRGKQATATKEDDFVDRMFIANTHDYILCFSNRGRVYWLKVYNVPQGSRSSRGKPIVNLVPLIDNEKITAILPVKEFTDNQFVFMATAMGTVKKTPLSEFSRPRPSGIIAVDLTEGDALIGVALTDGAHDVMLFSSGGKAVRFDENDVRPMGRNAHGVRGMALDDGQTVISMLVALDEAQSVLTATENGYGKRTPIVEYTRHGRGTKGMIAIQQSERNGQVVAAALVHPDDEVMLISTGGVLIRTPVKSIREMSRSTQGVTLINLSDGEKLAGLERVVETDDPNLENGIAASGEGDAVPAAGDPPMPDGEGNPPADDEKRNRRDRAMAKDKPTPDADLAAHRAAIDALDREILERLSARAAHAHAIGMLKGGVAAYRPERETQVIAGLHANNRGPLSDAAVTSVFREIMSACRSLEQILRVAYLGPAGTFSHAAVIKHFGTLVEAIPCPTFDDVFRAVASGQTDYAVVPVENSTEGAVGRTLDLMCTTDLSIVGEVKLRVAQNLLSNAGSMDQVTRVYSHGQSLAQCVQWLAQHLPAVPRIAVASNAEAARLAAGEAGAAAIAGENAGAIYGLATLAPHIEDEPNNTTRFWVLGRQHVAASGNDETSLVMSCPNRPGAVYELLEPLARHGVSMSRFESRPARTGLWEYLFFVDVVGHREDPPVRAALAELASKAPFLKLLGSYPAALD